jgi:hypothetical protein
MRSLVELRNMTEHGILSKKGDSDHMGIRAMMTIIHGPYDAVAHYCIHPLLCPPQQHSIMSAAAHGNNDKPTTTRKHCWRRSEIHPIIDCF